uniref:Putative secreted protein n=1 Tax=Anopheles marajoara TaxID=58244 RepID=A0A2M4C6Y7_9DIPT
MASQAVVGSLLGSLGRSVGRSVHFSHSIGSQSSRYGSDNIIPCCWESMEPCVCVSVCVCVQGESSRVELPLHSILSSFLLRLNSVDDRRLRNVVLKRATTQQCWHGGRSSPSSRHGLGRWRVRVGVWRVTGGGG